jgi:hypothetical protein
MRVWEREEVQVLLPQTMNGVVACLVEGNSQRATVRMTGISKKTVARLAVEIGESTRQ